MNNSISSQRTEIMRAVRSNEMRSIKQIFFAVNGYELRSGSQETGFMRAMRSLRQDGAIAFDRTKMQWVARPSQTQIAKHNRHITRTMEGMARSVQSLPHTRVEL